MKKLNNSVYVILDRDMEELNFDTRIFTTYEKAMNYINDMLEEGKNLYDNVSQDGECSWIMQDDGCQPRILELTNQLVH